MTWRRFLLVGWLLLPGLVVWGQFADKSFVHITSKDGLMNDEVRALLQDDRGFIWIGTSDGLCQYDGYQFTNYWADDFDTLKRKSFWVNFIYELNDHSLLMQGDIFQAFSGIFSRFPSNYYSNREDILKIAPEVEAATQLRTKIINGPIFLRSPTFPFSSLPSGETGTWLYSPQGILRWDKSKEKPDTFQLNGSHIERVSDVILLLEDNAGNLWFQGKSGIYRLDPSSNSILLVFENMFLSTPDPNNTGEFHANAVNHQARKKILCTRDGRIWIGHNGIHIYNPKNKRKEFYQYNPSSLTSPGSNEINCLMEDKVGRIWIGTNGSGISIWDPFRPSVTNYRHNPEEPNSLANNILQGAANIPGKGLLLGSPPSRPISYFDYQTETFKTISTPDIDPSNKRTYTPYWVGNNNIGEIYLRNSNLKTYRFDTSKMAFFSYRATYGDQKLPEYVSQGKLVASNGDHYYHAFVNGWYVGKDVPDTLAFGLYRYQDQLDTLYNYPLIVNDRFGPNGPGSGLPYNVFEYSGDSTIWMSGRGISRFYPKKEKFKNYHYNKANSNGFGPRTGFHNFFEDSKQNLWIGSFLNGGLYRIEKKYLLSDSIIFTHFRVDNSDIPSNSIRGFLEDSSGAVWVSTIRGICKYNSANNDFIETPLTDRKRISFSYGALKLESGHFVFPSLDGLFAFHPDSIRANTTPPRVHITDLSINNQPVPIRGMPGDTLDYETPLDSTVLFTESLDLAYAQNDFSLSFVALNYTYPERTRYKYKLEGYDKDWIETTPDNARATYTNIPHGDYTFRVIACNSDGVWNEEGDTMQISIAAPWWLTPWAYLGYLLLLGGLIAGIVRWRTATLQQQRAELRARVNEQTQELKESNEQLRVAKAEAEEANEAKSTFLSFVSHELRTPLTSIIGFANLNKRRLEEKLFPLIPTTDKKVERTMQQVSQNNTVIVQEGQRLADLINDLLDLAKIESGKIEWHMADIAPQDLISRTVSATEGLFAEKPDLKMITQVDPDLPAITGDFDRLLQVLLNLVSNAVKFTDSGEVRIRVHQDTPASAANGSSTLLHSSTPPPIHFSVSDTGPGIPSEYRDKIFERFQQVDGQQAGKPKGTGLGLPICKEIVEHHGGRIWVESEVGKGSTFYFTVPATDLADTPKTANV